MKDPGQCPIPTATGEPVVTHVPLFDQPAYFTDRDNAVAPVAKLSITRDAVRATSSTPS